MDEKQLKTLLTDVKNGLLTQLKKSEKSIKESVKHDIKETEKSIRSDIEAIKSEVAENKTEIEQLKARVDSIEEKTKSGDKNVIDDARNEEAGDEISKIMMAARCRIGIKPISLDDINEVAEKAQLNGIAALREAVKEFLMDELKLDDKEIDNLGDYEVHRKDTEDNDKVY